MLRLRHIQPGGVACFFFFEGMIGLAAVLALTGLVTWWAVVVLPACVAAMVKLNDLVAARLAPGPAPRNRTVVIRDEESVRRAAAGRADAPPKRQPRAIEAPPQRPAARADGGRLSRPAGEQAARPDGNQGQRDAGGTGKSRPAIAGPPGTPKRAIEPPRRPAAPPGSEIAAKKTAETPAVRAPRRRAIESSPPQDAGKAVADDKSASAAQEAAALEPAPSDALVGFLSDIQDDGAPLSSEPTSPEPANPEPPPAEEEQPENVRHTGGAHLPARPPDPAQVSAQRRARRSSRAGREKHG